MKKLIIAFVLLLSSIIYHLSSASVSAATLSVCPNAEGGCSYVGGVGIQQAIDAASNGDTISLKSGDYMRKDFTSIEGEKYNQCFISTKGKDLTIQGEGKAILQGQNDGIGLGVEGLFRVGICVQKGKVAIDNIWVQQTLSHALGLSETEARVTNFYTPDIDNIPVMIRRGTKAIIANSFINGPMYIDDDSNVRVINNTFYGGGVHLNMCRERYPSGTIINNIFSYNKTGIEVECLDAEKLKGFTISHNLVWKHAIVDGGDPDSKPLEEPDCSSNEFCDYPGRIIGSPNFIGPSIAGDLGWFWATDFHFKPEGSAAKGAGEGGADLGMYGNACTSGGSQACSALSASFPTPIPTPTEPAYAFTNTGNRGVAKGQNQGSFTSSRNITQLKSSIEYVLNNLRFTNEGTKEDSSMGLVIFIAVSAVYIMIMHFAVGINEFNIFQMIIYFVLGGFIGGWFHSYEAGLVFSIILSLIFI